MQPIELDFKPSTHLSVLLLIFTIGSCIILIAVLQTWWKWLLVLGVIIYSAYVTGLQARLIWPWSTVSLTVNSKNELRLRRRDGVATIVTVSDSTVVTPYLTIMHCKPSQAQPGTQLRRLYGSNHYLVILPDLVTDQHAYRQLRVWLRWGATRPVK